MHVTQELAPRLQALSEERLRKLELTCGTRNDPERHARGGGRGAFAHVRPIRSAILVEAHSCARDAACALVKATCAPFALCRLASALIAVSVVGCVLPNSAL